MSPLTPLHYLLVGSLALLLIIGVLISFRTKTPYSILMTIVGVLALIGIFSWDEINKMAYKVDISNISQERYYQSEQILIRGTVRNIGDYPVKNVVAVIKMSNIGGGKSEKAKQFSQPSVFAELFEGDDPKFKRQNIVEQHVVAESLQPGKSKTFRIMMDYPPYFNKASFNVTGQVD